MDRPYEQVIELLKQREKVEDMTVPKQPLTDQNIPRVQMTTVKVATNDPCTLSTDLSRLTPPVNSVAASLSPSSGILYSSTPIVPQASVSQMTTIGGQLPYQPQPLNTCVNYIQTMPVQSSAVFPIIVSSHHMYETAAGTHTEVQPLSSRNHFSQPLALASH